MEKWDELEQWDELAKWDELKKWDRLKQWQNNRITTENIAIKSETKSEVTGIKQNKDE